MKRKILFSLFFLLASGSATFVYREPITAHFTRLFLSKTIGKSFVCSGVKSSEGRISIESVSIHGDRLDAQMEDISFTVDFKEVFTHPKALYQLCRKRPPHWSGYLAAMKQYGICLDIKSGTCHLDDQTYSFDFKSGEKKHDIGMLHLYLDSHVESHLFLSAQFHMRGDQLISQLQVKEVEAARFFHLGAFAFPKHLEGYTCAEGTIEMHASIIFQQDGYIDEVSTRFKSHHLSVSAAKIQLQMGSKSLRGELNYPEGVDHADLPIWKRMDCNLTLDQGWVHLGKDFDLKEVNGTLGLDPREDPSLQLTGQLESDAKSLAMKLQGRGAIHEDHAYWLEFGLNLDDQKATPCDAFLSVCRPEKDSHVIQLEANGLLPAQVEMLKGYFATKMPKVSEWTVQEGTFGGKLVALIEEGTISHFEVQDMMCEKVALMRNGSALYFSKISGEGRLFDRLNISLTMPTSHFFGLAFNPLQEVYQQSLPDDFVQLTSTLDFSQEEVKTSASVHFPLLRQVIHFGYTSPVAFPSSLSEVQSGWARSECLTHEVYGPLVRMGNENLKVFGDVDLVGTYDGKLIELSLQIDRFLAKHPLIDFKADRIGEKQQILGRVRLMCVPQTGSFSGSIPLHNGWAYDRTLGLVAQDLDATLSFEAGTFECRVENGGLTFDGKELLGNIQGVLQQDGELTIKEAKGVLCLPTDREFVLALDSWTKQSCTARLLDHAEEIAEVALVRGENWTGKFRADLFSDPLDVTLSWDFCKNQCQLTASNDQVLFSARKDGQSYTVDTFESQGAKWKGNFCATETGFDLEGLTFKKGDLSFGAKGGFQIDLPQKKTSLGLRADLELEGVWDGDYSIPFATGKPLKCAYSPMLGCILSEVALASGDSRMKINHLEHLFHNKGATVAKGGSFHLTEALIEDLIELDFLPKVVRDFRLEQGLSGCIDFDSDALQTHATAKVETPLGLIKTELTFTDKSRTISFGEEEKLTFKMSCNEERRLQLDSISGKLDRIEANLARTCSGNLKGKLGLDFSLFQDLFDFPVNQYLQIWKTGGSYRFDGMFAPADRVANWTFKGKVKGQDFECGGYTIESMEAKVEVEPEQISIENLDLTDDAGKVWVSEGAIMFNGADWVFTCPLVEIRSFQPGLLRNHQGAPSAETPLVVKSATLENVRGKIKSPKSVIASGSLKFTNTSKKGDVKLPKNFPIATLRGMGLYESLFVPASGRMNYTIQAERCYLGAIDHVISEKGRSEFSPPKNGVMGYIDFNGQLNLDMQVRQHVVRSITSPISMKIRGSFDDPEITIK